MSEDRQKKPKPADARDASAGPELVVGAASPKSERQVPLPVAEGPASEPLFSDSDQPAKVVPADSALQRRSVWYNSLSALKYVSGLSKDDEVRVRDSDRATAIALLISCILSGVSMIIPALAPLRLALMGICDALIGVILVFYVASRFGIINSMSPRQALLAWQLMMGASFLGIFIAINLAFVIGLVLTLNPLQLPH